VAVDGGAAEFSWSLRSFDGRSIESCSDAGIDRVRLCWDSLDAEGGGSGQCRPPGLRTFDCRERRGITGFEIPPGRTSLFILPICPDGAPARDGTYDVPPPIVRTVTEGQVVTLSSLLIVAGDQSRPDGCPPAGCTCAAD
jgi:hypothetical protein